MQKWSRIAHSLHKSGTPVEERVMNEDGNIVAFPITVYF